MVWGKKNGNYDFQRGDQFLANTVCHYSDNRYKNFSDSGKNNFQ